MGASVEFSSLAEIRQIFGPDGVRGYPGRPARFTDDTQMTLFTAEGLIRGMQRFEDRGIANLEAIVWSAYLRWLDTQGERPVEPRLEPSQRGYLVEIPELRKRMAPGNTCLSALRTGRMGTPGEPLNDSKGCGGVMRVAPVGFCQVEHFRAGVEVSAITHGHPSGYIAGGALAQIISDLHQGQDLRSSAERMVGMLSEVHNADEVRRLLRWALDLSKGDRLTPERVESLGQGWVAEEALAISVYCALAASDFSEGVLAAVNHSGDSDSTGSITGQILGTMRGVEAIPEEWLEGLHGREIVERVANDFVARFLDNQTLDYTDYPPN